MDLKIKLKIVIKHCIVSGKLVVKTFTSKKNKNTTEENYYLKTTKSISSKVFFRTVFNVLLLCQLL